MTVIPDALRRVVGLTAVGPGVWANVTPAGISLATDLSGLSSVPTANDAFGVAGIVADPTRPGTLYVAAAYQFVWKSTDYGLTWTRVPLGAGGSALDGTSWSLTVPPDGSYLLANNGYGTTGGVYKSTDTGASWTNTLNYDVNRILISPTNALHVLALPHGPSSDPRYWESTDGGSTWADLGTFSAGNSTDGLFLTDSVVCLMGPNGVYRGVKSGTWSFTNTYHMEGPHGGVLMANDGVSGYLYVGGFNLDSFVGQIIRSNDGAQTWTLVQNNAGGYGPATIWMSGTYLYAFGSYAQHTPYGPIAWRATRANGASWTDIGGTLNAGMTNGPHSAVGVTDGTRWMLVLANVNAGLWRYIE